MFQNVNACEDLYYMKSFALNTCLIRAFYKRSLIKIEWREDYLSKSLSSTLDKFLREK